LNESKRSSEILFIKLSAFWISIFGYVVFSEEYKKWEDLSYMILSLIVSLPFVVYPYFFPSPADEKIPLSQRFWVKANIWIAILSFVGNYFWTHYFYKLLGAKYTFPISWELNEVPIMLYFITHAYFMSYHAFTSAILRRCWTGDFYLKSTRFIQILISISIVFLLAYITAFLETFSIASVPYYHFEDRNIMYLVGSAFYGIYFYVSFPMFYLLDEEKDESWTIEYTAIHSLASCMAVSIILDIWRLVVGPIINMKIEKTLPYLY